jgi:hypothetical protein
MLASVNDDAQIDHDRRRLFENPKAAPAELEPAANKQ